MSNSIQFTESRYTKSFWSYKHLFLSRCFPEWPQRVQQSWKKNNLNFCNWVWSGAELLLLLLLLLLFSWCLRHVAKRSTRWISPFLQNFCKISLFRLIKFWQFYATSPHTFQLAPALSNSLRRPCLQHWPVLYYRRIIRLDELRASKVAQIIKCT